MLVIVNTNAGGGRASRRWSAVREEMDASGLSGTAFMSRTMPALLEVVRIRHARGERTFIAAGGDGTVSGLVNALVGCAGAGDAGTDVRNGGLRDPSTAVGLSGISIGAIGLGSSNDFHKPGGLRRRIGGSPAAIDSSRTVLRDAISVRIRGDGGTTTRWFLLNGSFGATAAANTRFNGNDMPTRIMKRLSTPAAILLAIVRTILNLRDLPLTVTPSDRSAFTAPVTNLAVLKSPWVSGSLAFPAGWTARGMLGVVVLARSNRRYLIHFLVDLLRGRCAPSDRCSHFLTPSLSVASPQPVALELDGEIVRGNRFEFNVHTDFLRVCS